MPTISRVFVRESGDCKSDKVHRSFCRINIKCLNKFNTLINFSFGSNFIKKIKFLYLLSSKSFQGKTSLALYLKIISKVLKCLDNSAKVNS